MTQHSRIACVLVAAVGLAAGTAAARTSQDPGSRAAADNGSRAAHPTLVQQALRAAAAQQPAQAGATAQAASGVQKPSPDKPGPGEQVTVPPVNFDVVVAAPRIDIPLKQSPGATSVVTEETLATMPKGIGADEAFKLVPGVKVDNQADGERVHLSIRGQGLLTERGIRGIKILLDGLPLNDPTGFAPDLFDVDWQTVRRVEVFRGPSSALFGGGAAGGVINITTRDGGSDQAAGTGTLSLGSNGFWKGMAEFGGTSDRLNYRVSLSRNAGDGYRVHTAFDAANLYGKLHFQATPEFKLTAILAATSFFNENAEGLNLDWLRQDRRLPNPDALTFNEYQRTRRATVGVTGRWTMAPDRDLMFSTYVRHTTWKEAVPSSVQRRTYNTPGAIVQYTYRREWDPYVNHLTVGSDLDWQGIDELKHPNLGDAVEGPERLADQHIGQRSVGLYALDRLEIGDRWAVMVDLRSDWLRNTVTDHLQSGGVDLSGRANFSRTTGRVGASYALNPQTNLYASWGLGFMPPATEELANNPDQPGGFNRSLVPATSRGEEIGARGNVHNQWSYDVAFFHLATKNDFGRYRVPSRPLETFYRNAGSSRRYGLETSLGWYPVQGVTVRAAYTLSDFEYTDIKSLFGDFEDKVIPNSPRHQLYLDAEYVRDSHLVVGLGAEIQSGWFVDQTNVARVSGFALFNPRVAYRWEGDRYRAEAGLWVRNAFSDAYIAFTEPDPDGNSYQPGPMRELFIGARVWLGK